MPVIREFKFNNESIHNAPNFRHIDVVPGCGSESIPQEFRCHYKCSGKVCRYTKPYYRTQQECFVQNSTDNMGQGSANQCDVCDICSKKNFGDILAIRGNFFHQSCLKFLRCSNIGFHLLPHKKVLYCLLF